MFLYFWRNQRGNLPRLQWSISKWLWKFCLSAIILHFWISINSTGLVLSNWKVAQLKTTSVPRLELLITSLGLKLSKKIIDVYEINMDKVTFRCDSLNILWWIRGMSQKFKPFVANRRGEIQSLTQPVQCRYVPSKENSIDLVSQGLFIDQINKNSQWLSRPEFLNDQIISQHQNLEQQTTKRWK